MDESTLRELLEQIRIGRLTVDQAIRELQPTTAGLGFAHVDLDRGGRCGFPEVIFCEGKTSVWIIEIVRRLIDHGQDVLATRVSPQQAADLQNEFPELTYNQVGRTVSLKQTVTERCGVLRVITAGTSDLPVAEEARVTAECLDVDVEVIADVGVAGIHRLFGYREQLNSADALVVVAGMEGALASVVGGLVSCPVIAVPTSVGYGANLSGMTTMLAMLTSCASNVAVVNVDSGFNGGFVGGLIARRAGAARIKGAQER